MPGLLSVWLDNEVEMAGSLGADSHGAMGFIYADAYLAAGGAPLSISLPTSQGAFGDVQTRAFFDNLLPENDQLQQTMDREGIPRDDIVGLLHHLGADCSGAISCLPQGAPRVKTPGDLDTDYEALTLDELVRIVHSLADKQRLPDEVGDPSPVAGVQRKIALTQLPDGRLALPKRGLKVPTTHILKVPARAEGRDARLEAEAARLAARAGLDVSTPTAIDVDGVEALLISRFDRYIDGNVVYRIHQEDFAQALGLPSRLKYERNGAAGRRFDVAAILWVLEQTDQPALSRAAFLKATLFNLCIGNTDNHAKNHALIYDKPGAPRLAPLYDLMPTRIDSRYRDDLSFNIGLAHHPDKITGQDFRAFFSSFGLAGAAFQRFVEHDVIPLIEHLEAATPELQKLRMKDFDDLIGRETEQLVEALSLAVQVRERDYFPIKRGGWAAS